MKSFRETFYDLLREQKAKNGTWTKSFTWRMVMDIYDRAAEACGLTEMPGCVQHGFCSGCVQDENDKQHDLMREQLKELFDALEGFEARDNGPVDTGDPRKA